MRNYRISIIRHGHTEANEKAQYIGVTDLPLSERGKRELEEKAAAREYPKVEKVYTSPLLRCVQTAGILFKGADIAEVEGLREIDFGEFEGKTAEELMGLDSYKEWLKGGLDNKAPGGESLREMTGRTFEALNEILTDMMNERIFDAAVITHSGIIMNTLGCFGLPRMEPMKFACDVGEGFMLLVNLQLWQNGGVFEIQGRIPYAEDSAEDYTDDE